ncbi:PIN domain-containing protein [Alcaligenaceae bacterium]|nr:PIN domain-containing protein [Alcaligenaceae bacterium]
MPELVVLDTCVLISNVLRQGILRLAAHGCFRPVWSEVIGDEWRRNTARLWGVPAEEIAAQWQTLQSQFPHANLGDVSQYKQGLERSDPKDWHVIAAARKALVSSAHARVTIVTRNIRDFHRGELYHLGLGLMDPDQFLVRCYADYPREITEMLVEAPSYLVTPERGPEPLQTILKRESLFRLNKLCVAVQ